MNWYPLTNLEELSLSRVLALPNASRMMLDCKIWNFVWWNSLEWPVMAARYCRDSFMASVFPDPDSPANKRHWSLFMSRNDRQARSVTAYLKILSSKVIMICMLNRWIGPTCVEEARIGNGSDRCQWHLACIMEASCEGWLTKAPFQYWSERKDQPMFRKWPEATRIRLHFSSKLLLLKLKRLDCMKELKFKFYSQFCL